MISLPKGAEREIDDIYLTRYACYLTAQNGDARKTGLIAFCSKLLCCSDKAAELVEHICWIMSGFKHGLNWLKRKSCYRVCFMNAEQIVKVFAIIRSKGDKALFRLDTALLKCKLGAPHSRPLVDFLPTISIKAKDFAAEMTSINVQQKDLYGQSSIEKEHIENNTAVRNMMG